MPLPTFRYIPDEGEPLSDAIITALSEAKGRDVTEDECTLYETVDPEMLDGIFHGGSGTGTIKVEFTTHDAIVILWGNERLTIEVQDLADEIRH